MTIVGSVWKHKNNIIFRNKKIDAKKSFTIVQLKIWTYIIHKYPRVKFIFVMTCDEFVKTWYRSGHMYVI